MEIRHLRLIKEVAEKGSLTKAMDRLYLSQSALSHQLKEVESQLGAPLFHRVNKKLVLTGAGKIILASAEKILTELEQAEISVKKYASGDIGSIRLATECYTCYHWLPSLMIDFNREFPNVEVEIFPETALEPLKLILEGKLDLAIVSGDVDNSQIHAERLFTDELVAIVPAHHPWAEKLYIKAEDFTDQQVLIHSFPLESVTLFRQVLNPEGIRPKKVTAIQITDAAVQMIKAGMGIKVIAKWIIAPYLKDKSLVSIPVTRKGLHRNWYAITLKGAERPQYLDNFISHLKCNINGLCESTATAIV